MGTKIKSEERDSFKPLWQSPQPIDAWFFGSITTLVVGRANIRPNNALKTAKALSIVGNALEIG
jgi:hypothetical protein